MIDHRKYYGLTKIAEPWMESMVILKIVGYDESCCKRDMVKCKSYFCLIRKYTQSIVFCHI